MAIVAARVTVFLWGLSSLLFCYRALGEEDLVAFGYGSGPDGPDHWGSLKPDWKICNAGSKQSPVNIVKDDAAYDPELEPLARDYRNAKATLVNNGFNIMLRFDEGVGTAFVEGKNYSLQQVHWHTPSEHTLEGKRFAMEMHAVHKTSDGKIAVVATFYKLGHADKFVKQLMEKLKELAKEKCSDNEEVQVSVGVVRVNALKRTMTKYYRYVGSLTAPPCTEDIIWTVQRKVRSITEEQLNTLQAPLTGEYRNNSRPTQSLNGRTVKLYDESKKDKGKDEKNNDDDDNDDDDDNEDKDDNKKDEKKSDDKKVDDKKVDDKNVDGYKADGGKNEKSL